MNPDHALSVSWATGIATETNRGLQWFPVYFWLVPTPSSIGPALMARGKRTCCLANQSVSLPILKFHEDA